MIKLPNKVYLVQNMKEPTEIIISNDNLKEFCVEFMDGQAILCYRYFFCFETYEEAEKIILLQRKTMGME